ncbi:MAG: hypothetical protein U0744_15290 [Gemmataceae bacterium]
MSTDSIERQQQKAREFMSLLPLTMAVAGLPQAAAGQHFNEGQMEARATTLRTAYKIARNIISEVTK